MTLKYLKNWESLLFHCKTIANSLLKIIDYAIKNNKLGDTSKMQSKKRLPLLRQPFKK